MPEPSDTARDSLRLGFAGTPAFASAILAGLLAAGRRPVAVYTQPDRPVGRGRRLQPPPVKILALAHALPVRQPESLRGAETARALTDLDLDVLVVAAYGLILPPGILAAPRQGCLNVHASLLPRWRGAAPVERAIMAGDEETGVSIMQMDRGLDTGPVYLQRRCAITADTVGPALEARLAELGADALLECLDRLGEIEATPQPDAGVTYAHKLSRADAVVDWNRSARAIERQVRALCGRLPAFTEAGGVRRTLLEARALPGPARERPGTVMSADPSGIRIACADGVLLVSRLKLSVGRGRPLDAADATNGYPDLFTTGALFGEAPPRP
jgi:methionyl-tRNA formyltransferase